MNMLKFSNHNKGISTPILLSLVVLFAIIAGGLFAFLQYQQTDEIDEKIDLKSTEQTEQTEIIDQAEQTKTEADENWVIVNENDLLRKLEKSDKRFRKDEIGDTIVYWHQRMVDNAIIEGDYINYQFNRDTKELKKKIINWRDDLPEHLPSVISKEQAESIANGGSATLYFISPETSVFPIKPTPKNPCWIVRSSGDIKIVDAVEGKMLGYGISPPKP